MKVIQRENFIIGSFGRLDMFNSRLAELLSWSRADLGRFNEAGSSSYQDRILSEEGLREAIDECVVQDRKLFEELERCELFENLPDRDTLVEGLSANSASIRRFAERGVRLTAIGGTNVSRSGPTEIRVRIENFGPELLPVDGEHPTVLGYHWVDRDSGKALEEGRRFSLAGSIPPGLSEEVTIRITPPRLADPERSTVRVSVLRVGKHWLASIQPSHGLILD